MAGLSVLQHVEGDDPLADAVALRQKYRCKVVVGGKWTDTLLPEQLQRFRDEGVDVCLGPGETYFCNLSTGQKSANR